MYVIRTNSYNGTVLYTVKLVKVFLIMEHSSVYTVEFDKSILTKEHLYIQ